MIEVRGGGIFRDVGVDEVEFSCLLVRPNNVRGCLPPPGPTLFPRCFAGRPPPPTYPRSSNRGAPADFGRRVGRLPASVKQTGAPHSPLHLLLSLRHNCP